MRHFLAVLFALTAVFSGCQCETSSTSKTPKGLTDQQKQAVLKYTAQCEATHGKVKVTPLSVPGGMTIDVHCTHGEANV